MAITTALSTDPITRCSTLHGLLSAGVAEDKLPRTHNGVIEVFRQHAVQSGLMDRQLAGELSRTESLRIKADYTDLEMEPQAATETVAKAELFIQTVQRVFSLEEPFLVTGLEGHDSTDGGDKVSEPSIAVERDETKYSHPPPISLEETRRQARENWRKYRQQKIDGAKDIGHSQGGDRDAEEGQNLSLNTDLDQDE